MSVNFKTFSDGGKQNIIERRDCLFDPFKEDKTTFLGDCKDDPPFENNKRIENFKFTEIIL